MNKYIIILCFFSLTHSFSQESRLITWTGFKEVIEQDSTIVLLEFKNAIFDKSISNNMVYCEKIPISNTCSKFEIFDVKYTNVNDSEWNLIVKDDLKDNIDYRYYNSIERKQNYVVFYLAPFRMSNNVLQKVSEFKIRIIQDTSSPTIKKSSVDSSVLSSGNWYKLGVTKSGVYEMDYNFLSSIGVNPDNINPKNIRLYGNNAGMLQEGYNTIDDLIEIPIDVTGEDDNVFNSDDKVLFFGQSPDTWAYEDSVFVHTKNIYSDTTYYFLCFDLGIGARIGDYSLNYNENEINYQVSSYDNYFFHEEDLTNLVKTGRQWFGESFAFQSTQSFNSIIDNLDETEDVSLSINLAARSSIGTSFNIKNNSNNLTNIYIPPLSENSNDYFRTSFTNHVFQPTSEDLSITLTYDNFNNSAALAWLDYFSLSFRSNLTFNGGHLLFRDTRSIGTSTISRFLINSNLNNIKVWEVTNPTNINNFQVTQSNNTMSFVAETDSLREFIVFDGTDNLVPHFSKMIANQNIHGAQNPSYIIVTHPDFIDAANRLANYHTNYNGDNVLVVTTEQVYNEFSTGSQDITAIRNLVKLFYDRANSPEQAPKNLLLFGDASFDYKNKLYDSKSNFVPTYESYWSSNIESSFCTDDYFGMLDYGEGMWKGGINNSINIDLIDIGIGRIPVNTADDADLFVDKILSYNSLSSKGDWKNKICFVADDADASWEVNLISHADALADKIDTLYPSFNINKIYLDSYQQSLSFGSQRYPAAQKDLVNLIQDGVFIVNYVGHGGEVGWSSERVLELADINNFTNTDRLPVFVTATCEFTRYDDPTRISAGEYLLLNPSGGAIGLYSTSRTVAEGPTYYLVDALYNYLPDKNSNYTFGEAMLRSKNHPLTAFNVVKRKFSFFGDPNLKLSYPEFYIETMGIEVLDSTGQVLSSSFADNILEDTIQSLSHVRFFGRITDDTWTGSSYSTVDFSGLLDVTIFDKPFLFSTNNNDGFLDAPFEYFMQKNIIYNGQVDVLNGEFVFEFIVPKDISYQYGRGKISYYAFDSVLGEASGADKDILIGGVNENAFVDLDGPDIQLFIDDTNFVSGGYTNSNPNLLALLFDKSGINTIGLGIGHNIIATLDEDQDMQYVLNDYYESDLNSFQSGNVFYPFSQLSSGEHTLRLKAWDVYNNSSEQEIDFFVTSSNDLAIKHLLNYPNPASTFTQFVFEHNRSGDMLDITIDIYSLNGKLVKSLSKSVLSTGFRDESISWNIDNGIEKGIYVYKVLVQSQNDNMISEKSQKLIILR